ncbi:hypothetical protein DIPPA_20223 [Diplonema papillatum]|nr:hypothetical protein DIPPA_20223 [Diplonema papillatum]
MGKATAKRPQALKSAIPAAGTINYDSFGVASYLQRHMGTFESAADLEKVADKYMGGFRVHEKQQLRKLKRLKRLPDEEGWTTVVPKISGSNAATSQIKQGTHIKDYKQKQERMGKKKAKTSQDDFYAFTQTRKNLRRLVKIKKTLLKAQTRKSVATSVSLRNFADRA